MQLHPSHEILSSFPCGALPAPEAWRAGNRPAGERACQVAAALFGEEAERLPEEEVFLSPELDAAYDRAIDKAFARVKDLICGPAGQEGADAIRSRPAPRAPRAGAGPALRAAPR